MTCGLRWCVEMETRCRIPIWRTFGQIISQPRVTLQGAGTWWIHCHDSRAACHTAGCSHLRKSMSWSCHIAGCKNSIRRIENRFSPYFSVAPPCRYCFYSVVQKWVFPRPAGATRCPDKRENFRFIAAEMWKYSSQNCQNFEFSPSICPSGLTRLPNFYEILRFCTRLQVDFLSFYFGCFRDTNK